MPRIRITYRDSSKPPDDLTAGAFSQIAAKRRFGVDVIKSEDPEPVYFAAFVELHGAIVAKDDEAFDAWLLEVEGLEVVDKEDGSGDPSPAETTPSFDTSPASPPTLE